MERFAVEHARSTGSLPFADPATALVPVTSTVARIRDRTVHGDTPGHGVVFGAGGSGVDRSRPGRGDRSRTPAVAQEGDDPAAVDLLHRAMAAEDTVSYSGTRSSPPGRPSAATSAVVDVVTAPVARPRSAHGSRPMSAVDPTQRRSRLADGGGPVDMLVRAYDMVLVGVGTVAGRAAHVVEARRRDGSAAARLWLDTEFALPLRREIYDEAGATRAASAFVELRLHSPARIRRCDGNRTVS